MSHPLSPFFFIVGLFLSSARRRSRRAFYTAVAQTVREIARVAVSAGLVLKPFPSIALAAVKAADCAITRNLVVLGAAGAVADAAVGSGAAGFVVLFLAANLPWAGGNVRALLRVTGSLEKPPELDEAAFVASLAPLPDADLRRMADGLALALSGPLSARERQDRAQQRRLIYRVLDERRANRPARGSAPPRQKGP